MKIFTFSYTNNSFDIGNPIYDVIFAESLQQAINIRKSTIHETYCPSEKCMIAELEITPGFFHILTSHSHSDDRYVKPTIFDGNVMKFEKEEPFDIIKQNSKY